MMALGKRELASGTLAIVDRGSAGDSRLERVVE
jgi:hypothetical protein